MICDNDVSRRGTPIVAPGCWKAEAAREVTVRYNEVESDVLCLCDRCYMSLRRDARRHGYKITSRRIR